MRLEFEDAALRLYAEHNIALAHWHGGLRVAHFEAIGALASRQRAEHPGGCVFVSRISAARLPRVSLGMGQQLRPLVRADARDLASAHIIELDGLAGAAARRIVSFVMGAIGGGAPSGVFSDARAAASFLLPHLARGDVSWTAETLEVSLATR